MVKVMLIGNGAREHAIAEALVNSGAELRAFMNKKNPGIARLANGHFRIDDLENFEHATAFASGCDFIVVGPEAPLVVGIANAFDSAGIPCVGPAIDAAQLEGSKIFTRTLLKKSNNPINIEFATFTTMDGIPAFVDQLGMENVVVKPDGLTGGKGVKVFGEHMKSKDEIFAYCKEIFHQGGRVVIEERLDGEEFTLQTFVDGKTILPTPLVQDHKRAYENDEGPNTGGMGSYSMQDHLLPFITREDVEYSIANMKKAIDALKQETGTAYKGFLYGQFMKTKKGVKLVEFNARFGDPEAINILPIMTTSFTNVCQSIVDGSLHKMKAEFKNAATVVKYLVPAGYPDKPAVNSPIIVDEDGLKKIGARLYYASVNQKDDGTIVTSSSRTIGILGIAGTIEQAEAIAEKGTALVSGNLFHRKDIGSKELLQKRIDHMKKVNA
ncbi:MAG: phosphoribosylamine--glycine ligase [Candidatus Sigynarchaeota archaeon]